MNSILNRFILLPNHINLNKEGLHYKDLLIYTTIRSYQNSTNDLCIPSYDTIADKSGTSKKYVSASIKRLEKAGYLIVDRSSKLKVSNKYSFKGTESFSRIPYDVLDLPDLTANQRGMLLAIRQYFDSRWLELYVDLTTLCCLVDLTYRTVYPMYAALIKKGYIEKYTKVYKNGVKRIIIRLTDKVNWHYEVPQKVIKTKPTALAHSNFGYTDKDGVDWIYIA